VTLDAEKISAVITANSGVLAEGRLVVGAQGPPENEVFAYPSPINPKAGERITFECFLLETKPIKFIVTDVFGQKVWEHSMEAAGYEHTKLDPGWDGKNGKGEVVASGIYYVLLEVDGAIKSKKRFGIVK
jgi:hypothetical protein